MAADQTTAYQAKYFAYDLTREGGKGIDRLQQSLLNASVDLNPHQVEAALFALRSPTSKGALLADEVGLGKTIEAGLVMCQLWAERKRKILVVCPASLRKQWQCELEDKFNLPCVVMDAKSARQIQREGFANPYEKPVILISSYPFAARNWENLKTVAWDVVVMDEAHKLRNCYRESNKVGQSLRSALEGRRKLLLTATPLQNSLVELYGISTLIDADSFGDLASFRSRFVNAGGDLEGLRERMGEFCWRTLRKDVKAFVRYTDRLPLTESFACSDAEYELYEDVSKYLQDAATYAFPQEQLEMLTLIVRKVLASSTVALVGTLESILARLKRLKDQTCVTDDDLLGAIFADDPDLLEEFEEDQEEREEQGESGADGGRALPAEDGVEGGHAGRVTLPADDGRGTRPACPVDVDARLAANAAQYAKATAARVGEANNAHFKDATEKLMRWSEDQVAAATHRIKTLRARQLELERAIRHAKTLDDQVPLQNEFDQVRKDIRRARANVSTIEDETDEKRRRLLDALQKKLVPEVTRDEPYAGGSCDYDGFSFIRNALRTRRSSVRVLRLRR